MRPSESADPSSSNTGIREYLASLGLPPGLLSSAHKINLACESRLWLLDNSSQMKVKDSHVGRSGDKEKGSTIERVDNVTRWEELRECVDFHSQMASKCWIPTKYWLVNDPAKSAVKWQKQPWEKYSQKFNLCHGSWEDVASEMNVIRHVMKNATLDQSQCPLTSCIRSLSKGLIKQGPSISARNGHVTLIICTQGSPTDKNGKSGLNVLMKLQSELLSFSKLPVRTIIRLCTDNDKIRDIYNTLDSKLDSVNVLDDFWGEALEVYLHNPWLTYTMGLHRLRESGLAPRLMDELDTRPLCLDEIHQLCKMLFLGDEGGVDLPHPQKNWKSFLLGLRILDDEQEPQWNPIKKKRTPWINFRKLEAMHGGGENSEYLRHSSHNSYSQKHRHTTYVPQNDAPQENLPQKDVPRKDAPQKSAPHKDAPQKDAPKTKHHTSRASQDRRHEHTKPQPPKQQHQPPSNHAKAQTATTGGKDNSLALLELLKRWSHQPPTFENAHSLEYILVTVPRTFPPTNTYVEPHKYFAKWKTFDMEAFNDSGDKMKELLKRAVRKAKFFLHPDKLPKDLTVNQRLLFKTIWDVIQDRDTPTD